MGPLSLWLVNYRRQLANVNFQTIIRTSTTREECSRWWSVHLKNRIVEFELDKSRVDIDTSDWNVYICRIFVHLTVRRFVSRSPLLGAVHQSRAMYTISTWCTSLAYDRSSARPNTVEQTPWHNTSWGYTNIIERETYAPRIAYKRCGGNKISDRWMIKYKMMLRKHVRYINNRLSWFT